MPQLPIPLRTRRFLERRRTVAFQRRRPIVCQAVPSPIHSTWPVPVPFLLLQGTSFARGVAYRSLIRPAPGPAPSAPHMPAAATTIGHASVACLPLRICYLPVTASARTPLLPPTRRLEQSRQAFRRADERTRIGVPARCCHDRIAHRQVRFGYDWRLFIDSQASLGGGSGFQTR